MTKPLRTVLLPAFALLLVASGCGAPAVRPETSPPSAAGGGSALTSPVSINAAMVQIVDHAGHELWDAEREETAPRTDADWERLIEHATQIAGAGALIRMAGTGPADRTYVLHPDWQKFALAMSDAGIVALRAAESRNLNVLIEANGQLVDSCEGCHRQFKPALPTEGITHAHGH